MLLDHDLTGSDLPPKTLCLTFDDGPGPDSAAIGTLLASLGIAATFFGIGRHARERPKVIAQLREQGHGVGNHTETHPTLVSFLRDGGDVVAEVEQAQAALGDPPGVTLFRPPYGYWREEGKVASPVASALNASGRFSNLVGPIGWDIDARDWSFWQAGRPVEECGQAYLDAVEARTAGGIVLLHDWGHSTEMQQGNRSLELVRWLVPRLLARGNRFVGLDALPAVRGAIAAIQ